MTYYIIENKKQADFGRRIVFKTYSRNLAFEEAEFYKEKYGEDYIVAVEIERLGENISQLKPIER